MQTNNSQIQIDGRDAEKIVQELLARRWGYVPDWRPVERGIDAALVQIFARYLQTVIQRLNQAPEKNKLAFLDIFGVNLVPPQAARAPIVFQPSQQEELVEQALSALAPQSPAVLQLLRPVFEARVRAGTQVAAPPPPGETAPLIFETENALGITTARLQEVVSVWPDQDRFIDHTTALQASQPLHLFNQAQLQPAPHAFYLAHDTLLALAGLATLELKIELAQTTPKPLAVSWEYWNGETWKPFQIATNGDGTDGLSHSGSLTLQLEAPNENDQRPENLKTIVNGIEAFWIRGRLAKPLSSSTAKALPGLFPNAKPQTGAKALPVIKSVELASIVPQALKVFWKWKIQSTATKISGEAAYNIYGEVRNEAGQPLKKVTLKLVSQDDSSLPPNGIKIETDENGEFGFVHPPQGGIDYEVQVSLVAVDFSVTFQPQARGTRITFTLQTSGRPLTKAFNDETELDISKPFYPFGQQPQPGATFYFNQEEVFSKPEAKAKIWAARTGSPQDATSSTTSAGESTDTPLAHVVAWEYWNGKKWTVLPESVNSSNPVFNLDATGIIEFKVPEDIARTEVNGENRFWMRARLVSGSFGVKRTITFDNITSTFAVNQPPLLADFLFGYTWFSEVSSPQRVLTYNDFQYEDHSPGLLIPGSSFLPFKPMADPAPALYLGFNKKFPADRVGIYLDVAEKLGASAGPEMTWEYWNGDWQELAVEDETRNLRVPGILSFIGPADSIPLARFGVERHWIRGRRKENGPPGQLTINNIYLNAVWASQQRTVRDTPLGASTGAANLIFSFTQTPVLAGERIEVQELGGPRANVEWRILAQALFKDDSNVLRELEERLAQEDTQTDIVRGDLRLRRDRNKRVAEVWVRWYSQPHFYFSGPEDRHYVIDRRRGRLFFSDGSRSAIPPAGAAILAREFRTGGGLKGNVTERTINQLLADVPGVEEIFNPRAAEGGADGESLESVSARGPHTVRHHGRALTRSDYAALAREASPAVARARVLPNRNAAGQFKPGWVTVQIIPQSEAPRPQPSFGLREQVRQFIEKHAPAEVSQSQQVNVIGPNYQPIDVAATIAPVQPDEAGEVAKRAREALLEFFHPLRGGPERAGWEPGRDVFVSDVAAVLERVEGVDYVEELILFSQNGIPAGESAPVPEARIVVAGNIQLKLKTAEAQGGQAATPKNKIIDDKIICN
jgi:uncharacterized phage protein gp47/JayE